MSGPYFAPFLFFLGILSILLFLVGVKTFSPLAGLFLLPMRGFSPYPILSFILISRGGFLSFLSCHFPFLFSSFLLLLCSPPRHSSKSGCSFLEFLGSLRPSYRICSCLLPLYFLWALFFASYRMGAQLIPSLLPFPLLRMFLPLSSFAPDQNGGMATLLLLRACTGKIPSVVKTPRLFYDFFFLTLFSFLSASLWGGSLFSGDACRTEGAISRAALGLYG